MKTSQKGIDLIKQFESFRSKPYLCPAGVPTIGYGATYYPNGNKVRLSDPAITQREAESVLQFQLRHYENAVNRYVQVTITQNQFDALVSFTYNVGISAFKNATLLKKLNRNPNDPAIKREFSKWVRANRRVLKGLQRRRIAESNLYFS